MFKPDIFSNRIPIYSPSSAQDKETVASLVHRNYSNIGNLSPQVLQSGGLEVNSNNFLIFCANESYILKRGWFKLQQDLKPIEQQIKLANWLRQAGSDLPVIIQSDNHSNLVIEPDSSYWFLMRYVDASFYSGLSNELHAATESMRRLFLHLKDAPPEMHLDYMIHAPNAASVDILSSLEKIKSDWHHLFSDTAKLLEKSWKHIRHDLDNVILIEPEISKSVGLAHIDLHPHNILMSKQKVSVILDLGSFATAPILSSLAFNLFKLSRQAAVSRQGNINDSDFVKQKNQAILTLVSDGLITNPHNVAQYAKVEILRRMLIIFKLNLESNSRWNHVLPIQINALKEAELLFS